MFNSTLEMNYQAPGATSASGTILEKILSVLTNVIHEATKVRKSDCPVCNGKQSLQIRISEDGNNVTSLYCRHSCSIDKIKSAIESKFEQKLQLVNLQLDESHNDDRSIKNQAVTNATPLRENVANVSMTDPSTSNVVSESQLERPTEQNTPQSNLPTINAIKIPGIITNFFNETVAIDNLPKTRQRAHLLKNIVRCIHEITGGWPYVADGKLIAQEGDMLRFITNESQLFTWLQEQGRLHWKDSGSDITGMSFPKRRELFDYMLMYPSREYIAVETLPHYPELPGHYYSWRPPVGYIPNGQYLKRLLDFFDNGETEHDAALIKAMFLTPAFGGSPGTRPAFAIMADDRGYGKSALADAAVQIYGGVDLSPSQGASGEMLITRLLSPGAHGKRIIRIDNAKDHYDSAEVEALISTREISGKRNYAGEGNILNTFTTIITGNNVTLSRDLADRCFIIRLTKPTFREDWKESLIKYIDANRQFILADIIAELQQCPIGAIVADRWGEFVKNVLARCTRDTKGAIELTRSRRSQCDAEVSEVNELLEALDNAPKIWDEKRNASFISAHDATLAINTESNTNRSKSAITRTINGYIKAGKMPTIQYGKNSDGSARGFWLTKK